jgi:predicted RNA-binding protein with PUA-like domain
MTSKQQATIRMSMIPLVIIVALILGAGFLLLKGEINFKKIFNPSPQIRRIQGFPTIVYRDTAPAKVRAIIKSQDDLNAFLKQADTTGLLTFKDSVNFNREMLIGVTSDFYTTSDRSIRIKKVYENADKDALVVSIDEFVMDNDCETDKSNYISVDMIAITKTTKPIKFERVKHVTQCNSQSNESSGTSTNATQ